MSHRLAAGALWMVLAKLAERSLGLVSTLILVRLLAPADFGIVAMAMSLIALLELFSAFGLDTVLIQKSDASVAHFNTAWTMNVLAGCIVGAFLGLIAWPASDFFREPRLTAVVAVFALGAAIQGLENIGIVAFRKELNFDKEFRYLLVKKLMGFLLVVPLAFWLRDYWALVLGTLANRIGIVLYSYAAHPFRPRFSLAHGGEMMQVSKWLMIQNALTFLRERSASFVIGRYAGPDSLGKFSVCVEIASLPGTELVAPINRGILPGYVRLAADPPALGREYLSVMSGIALLAVPAVAGVALTAPFIVPLVLGPKWSDATPLLEILAFFGITQVLQSNSYSAFLALGKPGVFIKMSAIYVAILLAALLLLVPQYGAYGAAWAYLIAALAVLPVNFSLVTKALGLRGSDVVAGLWRPLLGAGVMYGALRLWGPAAPPVNASSTDVLLPLGICIAIGATTYVASVLLLWLASGRPAGAETWLLTQTRILIGLTRRKFAAWRS